jgi:hypothetical protein
MAYCTNIELSTYHDIIVTVKSDLLLVEQQKHAFTPVSEFQQFERLLYILDSRLNEFHRILPRLVPQTRFNKYCWCSIKVSLRIRNRFKCPIIELRG